MEKKKYDSNNSRGIYFIHDFILLMIVLRKIHLYMYKTIKKKLVFLKQWGFFPHTFQLTFSQISPGFYLPAV